MKVDLTYKNTLQTVEPLKKIKEYLVTKRENGILWNAQLKPEKGGKDCKKNRQIIRTTTENSNRYNKY